MVDIPNGLLRFFDREAYARKFIEGEIRFGLLDRYRKIEGERKDDTEGRASVDWNAKAPQLDIGRSSGHVVAITESDRNIHADVSSVNRYYILSTCHPDVSVQKMATKFKSLFVVRIHDSLGLLERIKAAWQTHPLANAGHAEIIPVVYNKGGLRDPDPFLILPSEYSYSQKPARYEEEKEFRYVLECKVDATRTWRDSLSLALGACGDICSLVPDR